jgi:NAD+ kinase
MNFAIHGRPVNDDSLKYIKELFQALNSKGSEVSLFAPFASFLQKKGLSNNFKTYSTGEEISETDIVLSLGGDGTLLEAITYVGRHEIPILGINMGRLGFLASTTQEDAGKAIDGIYNKAYKTEDRSLIKVVSDDDLFNGINFGLNEFTILKRDTSSMIVVHTYIDGEYLNSYWADGLIVSTPTGSTGYSLSCGGPLVLPQSNNFIIAPVSPHNLNVRPMVVSDNSIISFQIEGRSKHFLVSLDSRSKSVTGDIKLAVKKEDFRVKLISLKGYNYLQTLRSKLNWGLDMRN